MTFTFVIDIIILILLITLWSVVFHLEDNAYTAILLHLFSLNIESLTCRPFDPSINRSMFFTQPHLHTPIATSLFLRSIKAAFFIAWPTTRTMPTLYPLVISQASRKRQIETIKNSFDEWLPDERTTSIILLMKLDSSRSLREKYLAPPRIVVIRRGLGTFQTSKRICSALLSGVSKARRAN